MKKIFLGIWIGSAATFILARGILLAQESSIDVPGEMSEVVDGFGLLLFAALAISTIAAMVVMEFLIVPSKQS